MKEFINDAVARLLENAAEKLMNSIEESIKQFFNRFIDGFKNSKYNIIVEDIEVLNKDLLIKLATKYKVEGSSEVAVYKVETDDSYILYLAYTKDKELLDETINNYIVINSGAISRDVEKLFENHKLIILK